MRWREIAEAHGWDVQRVSLYDEEGVEGWRWTAPDGQEWSEIDTWDEEPDPPDEVRELLAPFAEGQP